MTISAARPRSGKRGRVTVGTTPATLYLKEWDCTDHGDDLDTTNFESSGYDEGIIGIEGCDVSFKGDWNAAQERFTDPPGLYPRSDARNVVLYINTTDTTRWIFDYFRFLSVQNNCPVRGLVSFDTSGKSNGTFTRPSGTATDIQ